jgi:serine protease Do
VVQFRRSTAVLTLLAASVGGGLIAALAVATHTNAPVAVTARADTSPSAQRINALSNSFADMIEKASPAVVKISSTRVIKASEQQGGGNNPMMSDPFFRQFFGGQGNARPRDRREGGLGSGVIISSDGYILTNNHVIDKATTLKVELSDGRDFTGKLIGTDPQTDVAVVKISASGLPTLSYANSDTARVGDLCFAIGNPFGQDHTVTMGIVSAKGRSLERNTYIQNFIQTDAAINPGNSGGALINAKGELIGMNTAILAGNSGFGGEGGNIGIGFAVPSNLAKQVADQLMKGGKVSRGYMGVRLQSLNLDMAEAMHLKDAKGAVVSSLSAGEPGAKAGLQQGDVITAIDGKKVEGSDDLTMDVISHAPGSTVTLDVIRDGSPKKITVTLGQRPTGTDWDDDSKKASDNDRNGDSDNGNPGNVSVRGVTVETLTPDNAEQVGVTPGTKGVVITDVDQSSAAAETLGRGMVITAVDRKPVTTAQQFRQLVNQAQGKPVLLTYNVGGQSGFTVLKSR